jgi:hypothetical protein
LSAFTPALACGGTALCAARHVNTLFSLQLCQNDTPYVKKRQKEAEKRQNVRSLTHTMDKKWYRDVNFWYREIKNLSIVA